MTPETIVAGIKLLVAAANGRLCQEPEVIRHSMEVAIHARLVPYNKAGVSAIYVWANEDGSLSRIQVAGQKVPEGGADHGFRHVSASIQDLKAEFDVEGFATFLLALAKGMR